MSLVTIHEPPVKKQLPRVGTSFDIGECFFRGHNCKRLFVRVLHGSVEIPLDGAATFEAALYSDQHLRNSTDCYAAPYKVEFHVHKLTDC